MDPRLETAVEVTALDLGFGSDIYIFAATDDLSATGFDAPVGSICVQSGGIYQKASSGVTDWGKLPSSNTFAQVRTEVYNASVTTSVVLDSVLVDTTCIVKWSLYFQGVAEADAGRKEYVELSATHNGHNTGAGADATAVKQGTGAILRVGGIISGLSYTVTLSGSGASQTMVLNVASTMAVVARAIREIINF